MSKHIETSDTSKSWQNGLKSFFGFGETNSTPSNINAMGDEAVKSIPADQDIILKIVNGFVDRSRKDIQKWRTSIALSEHKDKPRRGGLQSLYNDLMTDGHLRAQMRLRRYAVLNTEFSIVNKDTSKNNDEATDLINE